MNLEKTLNQEDTFKEFIDRIIRVLVNLKAHPEHLTEVSYEESKDKIDFHFIIGGPS